MSAIVASVALESKASMTRDILYVVLMTLLIFFGLFTDFPFTAHDPEDTSTNVQFLEELLSWIVLLAIFRRSVFRDLDDREYFSQHPINYKSHFFGKCLHLCLLLVLVDLIEFSIGLSHEYYYGNSLGPFTANDSIDDLLERVAGSLFASGFILLLALFRPLHFAVLIALVSGAYFAIEAQPALATQIPLLLTQGFHTSLLWAPIPWILGVLLFEWKMIPTSSTARISSMERYNWVKKLHLTKLVPLVITIACLGFTLFVSRDIDRNEISLIQKARTGLMDSLSRLENQEIAETRDFSFKFQIENKTLVEQLSQVADQEWERLHEDFGITFPEYTKIDVFVKKSEEHTLGSTRGSFIVINSEKVTSAHDKKATLFRTFRHELTHVLINRISNYQFMARTDILGDFLHEGLADLVERNWDTNDTALINEAALHYKTYDQRLTELIPKLGRFSEYDYDLNYSLGYVFWGEFVKAHGREKINDFLSILGTEQPNDRLYEGGQFLFYKANQAGIDLYQLFHATRITLEAAFQDLDVHTRSQTQPLKNFKAARLETDKILIPYEFRNYARVVCQFRKKDSLEIRTEKLEKWIYQGKIGGLCAMRESDEDELQLLVRFNPSITFRSQWIEIPK